MRNINEVYPRRQSAKLEKKYRIENIRSDCPELSEKSSLLIYVKTPRLLRNPRRRTFRYLIV